MRPDEWYEKRGAKPPEHIVHQGSDTVRPDNHTHSWTQQGGFLHCEAGQFAHGIPYDHLNKRLVGTSPEGAPLFADLTLSDKVPKMKNT